MSPLHTLWALSAVGALSFFAAGFLFARRSRAGASAQRPLGAPTLPRAQTARIPGRKAHKRAHTEADLHQVLNSVASLPGMKAAVLADELGLPIAALGDHAEPLAAFAGFVDSVAEKSRTYLPLSRVHRITIEDDDRTTITAHPTPLGEGSIAIVTLTTGDPPNEDTMDRVLASASRTFGNETRRREAS